VKLILFVLNIYLFIIIYNYIQTEILHFLVHLSFDTNYLLYISLF